MNNHRLLVDLSSSICILIDILIDNQML